MRRHAIGLALAACISLWGTASAQNLAETIRGLYGDSLGAAITSHIPGYGTHAVVRLLTVRLPPVEARDLAQPVFAAIARQITGTVSVSIFAEEGFGSGQYEIVLQLVDDTLRVFLNGEPFDP